MLEQEDDFFLPDFCNVRMVFAVILIGELLAIVLTLSPLDYDGNRWEQLGVISLFVQWVVLLTAGVLCVTRNYLSRLSDGLAATGSYLLLIISTTVISEATYLTANWITVGSVTNGDWHSDLLLRNLGISSIVSAIVLRYFYVHHQWAKNLQAKSQARIQALQSRIRPHFLFNSLNTIASLTRSQPEVAEEATLDLADLFRSCLAEASYESKLKAEWELSRRYLHIEQLRMGERLKIEWNIDELPDDAMLPQLTIQPLLENAIYHGVDHIREGGAIIITGRLEQEMIVITIRNPVPEPAPKQSSSGNRMAQGNVALRLRGMFDDNGTLTATQSDKEYYLVLRFPYVKAIA